MCLFMSLCVYFGVCVLVHVRVCVCRDISKEVLPKLTQALANRGENQNAPRLPCMHIHKATEKGWTQQGGGGKRTK